MYEKDKLSVFRGHLVSSGFNKVKSQNIPRPAFDGSYTSIRMSNWLARCYQEVVYSTHITGLIYSWTPALGSIFHLLCKKSKKNLIPKVNNLKGEQDYLLWDMHVVDTWFEWEKNKEYFSQCRGVSTQVGFESTRRDKLHGTGRLRIMLSQGGLLLAVV